MTRAAPEAKLQISIKEYFGWCMPANVLWTASMTGTHLSIRAATKAKAMGVRRGFPDLMFLLPDGRTTYIELKAPGGSLSLEQREFRDRAQPHGIWALCRSLEEVETTLRGWGVALKAHPFGGHLTDADRKPIMRLGAVAA